MENPAGGIIEKKNLFSEQISNIQKSQEKFRKLTNRFGFIRLVYFVSTLVLCVYLINERDGASTALVLLPFPIIFGWLVNRHSAYKRQLKVSANKVALLKDEIDRLDLSLKSLDGGNEFLDYDHPYSPDLDLFGRHSLFALINRSALKFGREQLAQWMLSPATKPEIEARQQAVDDLKDDNDWRLNWFAESRVKEADQKEIDDSIFQWFEEDIEEKGQTFFKVAPYIGIIQLIAFFILGASGILPWSFVGLGLFINILLLLPVQNRVMTIYRNTENIFGLLEQHKNLFKMAEEKPVQNEYLQRIGSVFKNPSASAKIQSLSRLLNWLHSRNGMMYWIVNPFVLSDYWIASRSIQWKLHYGQFLRKWFSAIGEWEAILSLSAYAFAHSNYVKAEILDVQCALKGEQLGHPLLAHNERVNNDFEMKGPGAVTLITGANMSGKSTFERSLGVNLILAQIGAVCCAKSIQLSPLQVFTSMRTQDNLEENTSSFYAELKRLKRLVDLTQEKQQTSIFYLLDEILKGTNSEDRNIGAESLIRQLMKTNSMGLISTHDLSLAKLENELGNFQNYSFNSDVSGDKILFDYKLNEGPCHTFNAVPLMKKMGIEII
ncbi:DNA mismatch repair protein [Marivirga lumbricoides]|uniref:DNA mismatch repair protein n=1 Tax=Marivirga lumbricoides TaxID=1046115 RepID=A0ABQ1MG96_9BACT|nr:DNA mismatch repair protein [Marivirga lumbricoides]